MRQDHPSSIHTAASLRRKHRRLDRRVAKCRHEADHIIDAMRAHGDTLHLSYQNGRALWSLSNGLFVSAEAAALRINNSCVASAGDALFDMPGQTWRHT